MWMQRLTTREPDEKMLEVAILSLKAALYEEFPDFDTTEYENNTAAARAENAKRAEGKAEKTTEEAPAAPIESGDIFVGDPADAPEHDL
jgi:hypothetical protein